FGFRALLFDRAASTRFCCVSLESVRSGLMPSSGSSQVIALRTNVVIIFFVINKVFNIISWIGGIGCYSGNDHHYFNSDIRSFVIKEHHLYMQSKKP
ncbi:MAG: hypothetical protein PF484_12185, partial [Bacteroidales bacterium]|nr:hypothetical protein [Bacteroidales bacterium]